MLSIRWTIRLLLALGAALLLATPALAGGWSVVTLDRLPAYAVAGEPLTIHFMVRQHGRTPMGELSPLITVTPLQTTATFTATAKPTGETGHYSVVLTFPRAGAYRWSIYAFGAWLQPMPEMKVLAPGMSDGAVACREIGQRTPGGGLAWPAGPLASGSGLLLFAGGLVLARPRRRQTALLLTAVVALAGCSGPAAVAPVTTAPTPAPATATTAPPAAAADPAYCHSAERGHDLFLAKGCVMCHEHQAVQAQRSDFADFHIGPNLTQLTRDRASLEKWLADPQAVKPMTEMPNLKLSQDEIGALATFLTGKP